MKEKNKWNIIFQKTHLNSSISHYVFFLVEYVRWFGAREKMLYRLVN